jgi:hypothetical protein
MILIGIAKVKGWVPEAGALQDSPLPPNFVLKQTRLRTLLGLCWQHKARDTQLATCPESCRGQEF